jgi:hypothetical protein
LTACSRRLTDSSPRLADGVMAHITCVSVAFVFVNIFPACTSVQISQFQRSSMDVFSEIVFSMTALALARAFCAQPQRRRVAGTRMDPQIPSRSFAPPSHLFRVARGLTSSNNTHHIYQPTESISIANSDRSKSRPYRVWSGIRAALPGPRNIHK